MTLEELLKIRESLKECVPCNILTDWGPSYAMAQDGRKEALRILNKEIKNKRKDNNGRPD